MKRSATVHKALVGDCEDAYVFAVARSYMAEKFLRKKLPAAVHASVLAVERKVSTKSQALDLTYRSGQTTSSPSTTRASTSVSPAPSCTRTSLSSWGPASIASTTMTARMCRPRTHGTHRARHTSSAQTARSVRMTRSARSARAAMHRYMTTVRRRHTGTMGARVCRPTSLVSRLRSPQTRPCARSHPPSPPRCRLPHHAHQPRRHRRLCSPERRAPLPPSSAGFAAAPCQPSSAGECRAFQMSWLPQRRPHAGSYTT